MSYRKTKCGGLIINNSSLKMIDGIVTDYNANSITSNVMARCGGQIFDGGYFKTMNGAITLNESTEVTKTFPSNCSLLFDADKFSLDDDGAIEYNPDIVGLLTITTTPIDAIILVTDGNDMVVAESHEGIYPVIIGKTYDYSVSADGYSPQAGTIKIDNAIEEIDVTL